jgi:acetolactate synthase-1/2/3 large subunit
VVFNDNAYGALKLYQDRVQGGRRMGVDLTSPDFARLADAYGAHGSRLPGSHDLPRAVAEAVERGGVNLIECPLSGDLLTVPPPWL